MPDAEQRALVIYELIRATSADRPNGFDSVAELLRVMNAWKEQNEGLRAMHLATPEIHVAFLARTPEWIRENYRLPRNFRVIHTLLDAIRISLEALPKPLPSHLIEHLLR